MILHLNLYKKNMPKLPIMKICKMPRNIFLLPCIFHMFSIVNISTTMCRQYVRRHSRKVHLEPVIFQLKIFKFVLKLTNYLRFMWTLGKTRPPMKNTFISFINSSTYPEGNFPLSSTLEISRWELSSEQHTSSPPSPKIVN